ncbi:iron chelate uptake ABC transporter family permease subunit [Hoylesella oralis]|uniref:iron chelate uptake ABC transporter family permease subunit n=1 Tax=Hoylesella oralis TaxID=28134 RepID=UPI0036100E1C
MNKGFLYSLVLGLCIFILFALNLLLGSVAIPAGDVWTILTAGEGVKESWRYIVIESRLPQAMTATLCGGALSVSGLMLQTAFKNPLAGPSVLGINGGAALGVALVIMATGGSVSAFMFSASGFMAVFTAAFVGAMGVTAVIFIFSLAVQNRIMLLIIGLMISYLSSSVISLLNFFATDEGVKSFTIWGLGDFSGVSLQYMPIFAGVIVIGLLSSITLIKPLNALLLGDKYAESIGVSVTRVRNRLLITTGLLTAITTAFCGPIAFIGLAVPHIARLLLGTENHRQLLPTTMLTGSAVALLCNLICYLPKNGEIIPLNAITPLIGAPVVIWVMYKKR